MNSCHLTDFPSKIKSDMVSDHNKSMYKLKKRVKHLLKISYPKELETFSDYRQKKKKYLSPAQDIYTEGWC